MTSFKTYIILDNVRSAENVGSIFRTADALGISKLFLVGITPAPIDRFGREQQKIKKAALGAQVNVDWEQHQDIQQLVATLKARKVKVIAVEQHKTAVDYKSVTVDCDTAFMFGNEVEGLSENVLKLSDDIIEIPMRGKKESLNVSVSVGVVLSRVLNL